MYIDNTSTDVIMAIQYWYVLDIQKYQGIVREEENNYQVMYEKKKIIISLEKDARSF